MPTPARRPFLLLCLAVLAAGLSGCSEIMVGSHLLKKGLAAHSCRTEGDLKVGAPYLVDGRQYTPIPSSLGYSEKGIASWYGDDFHGKATANGECFDMYAFTAAHKTLPLPTIVRVTNLENNKSIVVKVNDRGPFVGTRLIDLSYAAAQALDIARHGTAPVLVEAIGGPHNYPNGLRDYLALKDKGTPIQLGPAQQAAPLAAVATAPAQAEELAPTVRTADLAPLAHTETPRAQATLATVQLENTPKTDSFTERAVAAARRSAIVQSSPVLPPRPEKPSLLPPVPSRASVPASNPAPLLHTNLTIQVGAFADKSRADALLSTLPSGSTLSPLQSGGQTLWRVRTPAFNSVADAESALARLRDEGFNQARMIVDKE